MTGRAVVLAVMAVALPVAASEARLNRAILTPVEKSMDRNFSAAASEEPMELLGNTRGVYLEGIGAVFTAEVGLAPTPGLSPFRKDFTPDFVKQFHATKLKRLPLVRRMASNMAVTAAKALDMMPKGEKIVVVVRLMYMPWEDTSGLPSELKVQAERTALLSKTALDGSIRMEER